MYSVIENMEKFTMDKNELNLILLLTFSRHTTVELNNRPSLCYIYKNTVPNKKVKMRGGIN